MKETRRRFFITREVATVAYYKGKEEEVVKEYVNTVLIVGIGGRFKKCLYGKKGNYATQVGVQVELGRVGPGR
jgi:hypothetical protein